MSSDNVALLCYNSNLGSGVFIFTEKVILGQYVSVNLIARSDQDLSVSIEFSGDGSHWDYSINHNVPPGANEVYSTPVHAKWLRLRIQNLGLAASTYLRVYVYGTPSNSVLTAQLSKIGNVDPYVNVTNLPLTAFGQLSASAEAAQIQYAFNVGTSGNMFPITWSLPYSDISSYSNPNLPLTVANGVLSFGPDMVPNSKALLWSSTYYYKPGTGIVSRFTAYFEQGLKSVLGNHPTTEYVGIGNYLQATMSPYNGYFFGYGDPTGAVDNFGIVYLNQGVRTFYPRNLWNVDRCDGTYLMPELDFSKMQVYQITFQYLGFGMVRFYIENPTTGLFSLVHTINRANLYQAPSNLSAPSLGLIMYAEVEAGVVPTILADRIGCASFYYGVEGQISTPYERCTLVHQRAAVQAEAPIVHIRNNSTFYGTQNYMPLITDLINFSCDGTKNAIFKVYRNSVLNGALFATTPYPTLFPISTDNVGTIVTPGVCILAFTLDKAGKQYINLADHHIILNPSDILTITAQSAANSDVIVTSSWLRH